MDDPNIALGLPRTNWSGTNTYSTDTLYTPETVEEVCRIVREVPKVRTIGTRHSFSPIANSPHAQIALGHLDSMELHEHTSTVSVGTGVNYGRLGLFLHSRGCALDMLASLPHISVAGACATASHGSGWQSRALSSAVSGFQVCTDSRPDSFDGIVGCIPLSTTRANAARSSRVYPGPWYDRLPHFKIDSVPSSGVEFQSQFNVPLEHAFAAISAIETLRDRITPYLFTSDLRIIEADDFWMSPAYKRRTLAIGFTWRPNWPGVSGALPAMGEVRAPFAPRPHWVKIHSIPLD